jgi:hypothetical protein
LVLTCGGWNAQNSSREIFRRWNLACWFNQYKEQILEKDTFYRCQTKRLQNFKPSLLFS